MFGDDENANGDTGAEEQNEQQEEEVQSDGDLFYDDRDENGKIIAKEEKSEGDDEQETEGDAEGDDGADDAADDNSDEGNEDDDKDDKEEDDKSDSEIALAKDSLLDKADVQRVSEYAKENKLSTEDAQKVLDIADKAVADYAQQLDDTKEERSQKVVDDAATKWLKDSRNDKDIGGKDFKQNVAMAHRVVEKYGTPELKAALNESGLGNHPELIRLLSNIGKAGADDTFNHKNSPPADEKPTSSADLFYEETYTQ